MMNILLQDSCEEDYVFIKKWFEDPDNNILFTSELRRIKEYKKFFYLIALKKKDNKYFTIFLEDSDEPVGFIALINIDSGDKFAQVWYVLGKKNQRGKGIMSIVLSKLLKKCKKEFDLHTVHTWVVEDNIGSIKVLQKNGFKRIGVQEESYFLDGEYKNRVLFNKIL